MIDNKRLTPEISVCAQPSAKDLALIHTLGFKSVICNRPDGEAIDQHLFGEIRQAATYSGLESAYLPIAVSGPTDDDVEALAKMLASMPRPVLAYCETGARSEALVNALLMQDA